MKGARIGAIACALVLSLAASALARAQEPAPGPAPIAAPALDASAPHLVLGGRRVQSLSPHLEAYAICDERCEFEASARVRGVPGLDDLRVVTPAKASEGGTRMHFHIRVSPRAHKLMSGALRDGRRVSVTLDVLAFDLADNATDGRRWIRVRPPA